MIARLGGLGGRVQRRPWTAPPFRPSTGLLAALTPHLAGRLQVADTANTSSLAPY
jgi:hypothetical protein